MHLKTDELYRIQQYVVQNGLTIPEVQDDVIDHLCCLVEEKAREGIDFETAFQAAQELIPQDDVHQIQKDTIYYLTIKNRLVMIKTLFITAYASAVLLVLGIFLAVFGHEIGLPGIVSFATIWTGAAIFCFGFLPVLFYQKYKQYTEQIKA